jgi:hypothetical protein
MARHAIAERVAIVSGPGASLLIADDASHREAATKGIRSADARFQTNWNASRSQFDRSQTKRIHDNRNRAEAHGGAGDHRTQQ